MKRAYIMPENQNIEWKESWRDEYLKWICGFANAHGGKIYIGVNDSGNVVGLSDSKKLMEDIPNKIIDILGIGCDVNLLKKNGKEYIEIIVDSSTYPVNYKGEYHYRYGSTMKRLVGASLTQFLLKKTGATWDSIPIDSAKISDLETDAFEVFKEMATEANRVNFQELKTSKERLLDKLNLIDNKKLTKATVLLFARRPEKWVPGSFVKIAYFRDSCNIEYQDEIHGSILTQPDKVVDLLFTKYLKGTISYKGINRIETFPYPKKAIRELVVNAIAHRDYSTLTPIQIRVYNNRLVIANDCVFPEDWTVNDLLKEHKSRPYNPNIASVFYRAGLIESWGRGINTIGESCKASGNKKPEYDVKHTEFSVTMFALQESTSDNNFPDEEQVTKTSDKKQAIKMSEEKQPKSSIDKGLDEKTSDKKQAIKTSDKKQAIKTTRNKIKIEEYLRANGFAKASDIASNLHLSQARIRVILSQMDNVIVEGANRNRVYRLRE